eukprot:2092454-Pyramimonas_sp.AAC.1
MHNVNEAQEHAVLRFSQGPMGVFITSGYILTTDQSDAGSAGIFSRRTNQTQEARVYSRYGPIRRRKRNLLDARRCAPCGISQELHFI